MYKAFYGLKLKPFTLTPDPDFLYRGETHREGMATLEYGLLNEAGFVVLTGKPGMGKTTLLQQILAEHRNRFTVGLITNTHGGMDSLLPWILLAFDLNEEHHDTLEAFHTFQQFLGKAAVARRPVLLIVDEAHNLGVALLEELRLLSNLNQERAPVLQIVLSGQPDLRQVLQRKDLTQFAQRVTVDHSLEPFTEEDSRGYVTHRLRIAGRAEPLFTDQAILMIHRLTGGIPRLINQLCDSTLLYGFAEEVSYLSTGLVMQAAKDRSEGGILPLGDVDALIAMTNEQKEAEQAQLTTFAAASRRAAATVPSSPADQPNHEAAGWYEHGLALKKAGRCTDALHQFSLAALDTSYAFKAMAQAGICLKAINRPEEAVSAFRRALLVQPTASIDAVQVRYLLARTLESLDRIGETLEEYRWIGREAPGFKDVAARIERLHRRRSHSSDDIDGTSKGESWMDHLHRILGTSK